MYVVCSYDTQLISYCFFGSSVSLNGFSSCVILFDLP